VIDAIRCAKLGLDRGLSGAVGGPSAYFMKTPPEQFTDEEARQLTETFIREDEEIPLPERLESAGEAQPRITRRRVATRKPK
jgi:myo-inositol-1-phosphate synthase